MSATAGAVPVRNRRIGPLALAAAFGAVAALGQAPWALWPFAIAGAAGAIGLAARLPGLAGRIGWAFGTAQYLLSLHWIVSPFAVDPAIPDALGWVALALLAAGLGVFPALALRLAALSRVTPHLAGPVLLLAAEVVRMHLFTGFPWAAPGQALVTTPLLALAALGGPHLLDAVVLAAAGGIAGAVRHPALAVCVLLALAGAWIWGGTRPDLPPDPAAPLIRLVQPGTEQGDKWRPELREDQVARQIALSTGPAIPALTVWPETSLLYWLHEAPELLTRIEAAAGGPVLLGSNRWDGAHVFNAAVLVGPGGQVASVYDKHHLVPFGEYVPFRALAERIGLQGLAQVIGEGFTPGPGPQVIDVPGIGPVLPLICYEAVFPASLRGTARPRALVQITNDAWFGSWAGPEQHLAQARMRAAESGLPLLRAANTGITAAIDARGDVVARLDGRGPGRLDAPLPPALAPTPYARTGDWPILAMLLAALAAIGWRSVQRRD